MTRLNHRFSGLAGSLVLAAGLVITAQASAAEDAVEIDLVTEFIYSL